MEKAVNILAENFAHWGKGLMRADWPQGEETDPDWETLNHLWLIGDRVAYVQPVSVTALGSNDWSNCRDLL